MEHLERLKQQLKEIFLGKVFPWFFLLFLGSIYLGLLIVAFDKEPSFLDSLSTIASLMAGIAGLCASYVAISGINIWKKQITAPSRYKSITDTRAAILQLKLKVIDMLNRIYAYGFDDELTIRYQANGDLYKKIESIRKQKISHCLSSLEVYFPEHCSEKLKAIESDYKNLNLQIFIYLRVIAMKDSGLVAYETLNTITADDVISDAKRAERESSSEEHNQRKDKVQLLFSKLLNKLDELEKNI